MNSMKNTLGSLLALIALAGCATAPAPDPVPAISYKPQVIDTACNWTKLITVTDTSKFTDVAAKAIVDQVTIDARAGLLTPKAILAKAIVATGQDWLTPVTAKEILAHDNARAANCKK